MGQVILTLSVVHIFVSFGSNGKQEGEDEEQTSEQEKLNPLKNIGLQITLQQKSPLCVPRKGIARPQSQFLGL
jgi:hypothetical protein